MDTDNRSRAIWSRLGGQLGVGLCLVGFLLVFLGWNGAASVDRVTSQFPYLLSGGVAGLCFVILGVGMIVVQNQRADRAALQSTLREVQEALERAGLAQDVDGQRSTFRRPGPRPEALAGARSPQHERPIVAADEPAPTGPGAGADDTQEVPIPIRPVDEAPEEPPKKKKKQAPARRASAKKASKPA
jgi:hypothetical protein